ncbi:MAG: outer membrane lipoprotein carrier protein LolA, partial [Bacteroidota bacterium]
FSMAQAQRSPQADKVIKQSKAKYDGLKDLQASFVYTLSNPNLKKPIVKKGHITLKDNKYRVKFSDEEMYCDGKYVWVKLNEDEEIIKSDFEPDGSTSPDRLYKIFEEDSKTRYDGEESGAHKVTVFSNDDKAEVWKSEIWISKSSKLIDRAVMHGRNGSQYEYKMSELKLNSNVADDVFRLNEAEFEANDWIITDQSEG